MIFKKLLDGLFYYTNCPLCNGAMLIRNEGFIEDIKAKNNWGFNLIFYLYGTKLIINPATEELFINQNPDGVIVDYRYLNKFNHIDFFNVNITCKECFGFEYCISMQVDFAHKEICSVFLDNMTYYFKDENYMIINDFSKFKTKLVNPETGKSIVEYTLLNNHEPKAMLKKLKKLMIFI